MNRSLLTLAIAEALVIALLAYLWLGKDETARPPDRRSGIEEEAEGRSQTTDGRKTGEEAARPETKSGGARGTTDAFGEPTDYAVVHGRISSSDGSELKPPLWLNLTKPDGSTHYTQVAADGHYAIAGLAPGSYMLHASGRAYGDAKATLELKAGATRRDFELAASMAIRIKVVTPEGMSLTKALQARKSLGMISGVIGVATREPLERLPLTELRSHSRYGVGEYQEGWSMRDQKLPEGVVGILMVKAPPPFYVNAVFMHFVLMSEKVTGRVEEITFVLKPENIEQLLATVKVRLVDAETGAPVKKGRVSISDRQSGGMGAQLDGAGVAEQKNVPPGLKELQIWAQGYEAVHNYIRVADSGVHDLGTYRLHKAVEIAGEIVDEGGKPVAAQLVVRNLDRLDFPQPLSTGMSYRSDTEGKFKVASVGRGRYLIRASAKGHALGAVIVDTSGGAVDNVRLQLKQGTQVTLKPEGDGRHHYLVTIRRDGVPYYTRTVRGPWPLKCVLAPGRYQIEVAVDGVAQRTEPLDVGAQPIKRTISR